MGVEVVLVAGGFRPAVMPVNEPTGQAMVGLLAVGVLVWALAAIGIIIWFFATVPEPGLGAIAIFFNAWGVAYFVGALGLAIAVTIQLIRRTADSSVIWAGGVYLGPALLWIAIFAVFLSAQSLVTREGDFPMLASGFAGPYLFVLYFVGLLVGFALRNHPIRAVAVGALAPPVAGVALAALVLVVATVSSPQWQNRDTFGLTVTQAQWQPAGGLLVDVVLDSRRSGPYFLHAFYRDQNDRTQVTRGEPVEELTFDGRLYVDESWLQTRFPLEQGRAYRLRFAWPHLRAGPDDRHREVVFRLADGPIYVSKNVVREFRVPLPSPVP